MLTNGACSYNRKNAVFFSPKIGHKNVFDYNALINETIRYMYRLFDQFTHILYIYLVYALTGIFRCIPGTSTRSVFTIDFDSDRSRTEPGFYVIFHVKGPNDTKKHGGTLSTNTTGDTVTE